MKKYTYYCIAGHSLSDPGAIGVNGVKESDLTIKFRNLLSKIVADKAAKQSIPISVWVDDDKDSLKEVISKIGSNIQSIDMINDIHFNAGPETANGMECVVADNASQRSVYIAGEIARQGSIIMGIKHRGVKTESQTPRKKLGILRMKGSAVIIEISFLTNENDLNKFEEFKLWLSDYISDIVIEDAKKQLGITT